MINIHLFNWPQRVAVGCVIGVDVHPSGQYTYPYPIMKLPIVMPQDCFYGDNAVKFKRRKPAELVTFLLTRINKEKHEKSAVKKLNRISHLFHDSDNLGLRFNSSLLSSQADPCQF